MIKITGLKSDNDKKLENLLENSLSKFYNSASDMEKYKHKVVIDEIYDFECERASKSCANLDKSIGFKYFIENYRNFELGLNYFASKYIDDILYYKENTEASIHDSNKTFLSFNSNNPKSYLIDIIGKYDEDLSNYIKLNMSDNDSLDLFIDYIKNNWDDFEGDKSEYKQLISTLEKYYDEHGKNSSCSKVDILIYLFLNNNIINEFKKYYVMEDTTDEEFDELIEENDIYMKISSIRDIKLITEMDRIIKNNRSNKAQRLKF